MNEFPPGRQSRLFRLAGVLGMALLLGACAGRNAPSDDQPLPRLPQEQLPSDTTQAPAPPPAPKVPAPPAVMKTHPRYAPPPQGDAFWDPRLGVYVVDNKELYYRERLYYRWDQGWYCAGRIDGPWESVDGPSVPPGLRSRHP